MMRWKIAQAKMRFSELLRAARDEPQLILNRELAVAAVVDAATFEEFEAWRAGRDDRSLGEAFATLRTICADEGYALQTSARKDRGNDFADALPDSAV
jgi:prevent-host-death family protein